MLGRVGARLEVHRTSVLLLVAGAVLLSSSPVWAGAIDVPGDFPGHFQMDLLAIDIFVDVPSAGIGLGSATINPDELGIAFSASPFTGTGTPDWGTSRLSTIAQTLPLGGMAYVSKNMTFFIDSGGPGTLTDLGNGTGDWELTLPIRVDYGGYELAVFDLTLSTGSTFSYYDRFGVAQSVSGQAMDYATGDAVLVAQATLSDWPVSGIRGTLVIEGNEPVLAPEPSSFLLVAAGLIGLAIDGSRRRV